MKVSSDALTFNDLLEEAQRLQADHLATKVPIELGPEPEAVRKFQEEVKARLERHLPRRRLRFPKGDSSYSSLPMDAKMWLSMKGLAEQRKNPLHFSDLGNLLELETWKPRDAMLILAGVDPSAALVDWSYENFLGAEIEKPKIRRATWFSNPSDTYDWPLTTDFEESPSELMLKIRRARASKQDDVVQKLEEELRKVNRMANDPTACYVQEMLDLRSEMLHHLSRRWFTADHDPETKHSPEYFVRWAEARGFVIEWASWARNSGYIDTDPPATSPPFFDADAEDYPKLLHIAVRAWDHARQGSQGTAKQRISAFLQERFPDLSASEREAIAMIGNWQKAGGRPRNGG